MDDRTRLQRLASPRVRLGLLAVVVLGVAGLWLVLGGPSRDTIQEVVDGAGVLGPLLFILLYAALTVLLVPGVALTVAGGFLFGPYLGTALAVTGATLGATTAFVIGRGLGRGAVTDLAGERMQRLDTWLSRRGFLAVLYVRLIPLVPFNVLNYVAGVTATRLRHYVLGTLLGIVPGSFAYAALGGTFDDPTSPVFLTAVGLLIVLAVGGPVVARRLEPAGSTG